MQRTKHSPIRRPSAAELTLWAIGFVLAVGGFPGFYGTNHSELALADWPVDVLSHGVGLALLFVAWKTAVRRYTKVDYD